MLNMDYLRSFSGLSSQRIIDPINLFHDSVSRPRLFFPVIRRPVIFDFGVPENTGYAKLSVAKTAACDAISVNNGLDLFV